MKSKEVLQPAELACESTPEINRVRFSVVAAAVSDACLGELALHFGFFPHEGDEVEAVEVDAALLGLEATTAEDVHLVADNHRLVFVPRGRLSTRGH